jgi:hypothetical protein
LAIKTLFGLEWVVPVIGPNVVGETVPKFSFDIQVSGKIDRINMIRTFFFDTMLLRTAFKRL